MKVFEEMDKEHANMYRWIRKTMPQTLIRHLSPESVVYPNMSEMEVDRVLRTAFETHEASTIVDDLQHRSKIRSGLLPASLGMALKEFTLAAMDLGVARTAPEAERLEFDKILTARFETLCNEMVKLR